MGLKDLGCGSRGAEDVGEVQNYVRAHEFGLHRLSDLPLSLRLIRELHEHLMQGVRGADQTPGQFRDGNGRVGRLLISMVLCERGLLPQPLFYLSAYFERTRDIAYLCRPYLSRDKIDKI